MKNSIITLLTDFGTKDHYVASVKGVILRINPKCTLIDITHQVNPQDIREGAFLLSSVYSFFPKGTIHLSVVDPGVGGPRNPILLVTKNYFFIGPDNGLLTLAAKRDKVKQIVSLTNRKYFLPMVSTTFHGRDIFAPIAGHLSLGIKPKYFGEELDSWEELDFGRPKPKGKRLTGEIIHIDTFGNLISNIDQETFSHFTKGHAFVIRAGEKSIHDLRRGYWEGKKRELMVIIGSGDFLEISVKEGNAQKVLKLKRGDRIIVENIRNSIWPIAYS